VVPAPAEAPGVDGAAGPCLVFPAQKEKTPYAQGPRNIYIEGGRGHLKGVEVGGKTTVVLPPTAGLRELKTLIRKAFGRFPFHKLGRLMLVQGGAVSDIEVTREHLLEGATVHCTYTHTTGNQALPPGGRSRGVNEPPQGHPPLPPVTSPLGLVHVAPADGGVPTEHQPTAAIEHTAASADNYAQHAATSAEQYAQHDATQPIDYAQHDAGQSSYDAQHDAGQPAEHYSQQHAEQYAEPGAEQQYAEHHAEPYAEQYAEHHTGHHAQVDHQDGHGMVPMNEVVDAAAADPSAYEPSPGPVGLADYGEYPGSMAP